jgi:hypothetical protein
MAYVWHRWLADEFRAAGLRVIEVESWQNRGRPASVGSFDPRGPATIHHTGATSSASNPGPTLRTLIAGRSDLPGPLCHYSVRADGAVVIVAAGRANHAGGIGKTGVVGMPFGADGNVLALGNEVDTNGTQTLPKAQREAIALTTAVVLKHFDRGAEYAHRHQDISATGKWDIGSLTTRQVRAEAGAALNGLDDMTPPEVAAIVDARIEKALRAALADAEDDIKLELGKDAPWSLDRVLHVLVKKVERQGNEIQRLRERVQNK